MGNIGDEAMLIALCDSLLWMMIVAEADWTLAPSFSWIQGIWGSILCGSWYRCHGTLSHLVLRSNRMFIICVPRNQDYTNTAQKMDTE
jgi:hypothetical protein